MATYLLNILPSKTKNHNTPTFLLYSKHPTYTHLRTFGCLCFPLTPSSSIHKLENRSSPCVFLGYPSNHRGYKCYDLKTRKLIISRHVVFDETVFPFATQLPNSPSYDFLHTNLSSDPHYSTWESVSFPPSHPPLTEPLSTPIRLTRTPLSPSTPHTRISQPKTTPPITQTYSRRPKPPQPFSSHPAPTPNPTPCPTEIPATQADPTPLHPLLHHHNVPCKHEA